MDKFSYSIESRLTPRHDFILDFCGKIKDKKIVDIGCGFGWFEKVAIKKGARKVIGIEPSKKYIEEAKFQVDDSKVEFLIGKAGKLPLKDNCFDKAIMLEVLEHIPNGSEAQSIKEINRVLKKNGELILSTPKNGLYTILLDPAWFFGHRHYSLEKLKSLLETNGFLIKEVFIYGGFWEMFRMFPHYFFKWVLHTEDPFKHFFEKKMAKDKDNPNNIACIYIRAAKI